MPPPALRATEAANRYRRLLLAREKIAAVRLVETYGDIWRKLKPMVDAVSREIEAMEKPGVAALGRSERLKALKRQVEAELSAWAPHAEGAVVEGIEEAIRLAQEATRDTVASGLGKGRLSEAIMARWDVLPRSAVIEIIGMTDPVGALGLGMAEQMGPEVAKAVVREFATGIALGRSPLKVGAAIRRQFSVPLDWALRNSRTAMLYAYRESSRAQARANDHIVKGWTWSSAKQATTCAACLALDGSFHTLDERLDDHYNGRCSAVFITKTWEELGYPGLKETTRQRQTGEEWLREQPPGVQDKILGRAGGKAWRAGQVDLGDVVGYRIDPAYGRMVSRRTLGRLG